MARPLRIEFPGALYFISNRGNGGNPIFKDSGDGSLLLEALAGVCTRFNWKCLCYCFMSDSYYLLVETPRANLSKGMRQLNGVYTQNYNRRHSTGGHVFQGRYRSVLVQKEGYLSRLVRQIFLFPLSAGFVKHPNQFKWASCKYLYGKEEKPEWLEQSWFGELFSSIDDFEKFLFSDQIDDVINHTKKQIFLGNDDFITYMQGKINTENVKGEIPKQQLTTPISRKFPEVLKSSENKNEAIARIYLTGDYTLKEIGEYVGIHYSGVSKIVSEYENKRINV